MSQMDKKHPFNKDSSRLFSGVVPFVAMPLKGRFFVFSQKLFSYC